MRALPFFLITALLAAPPSVSGQTGEQPPPPNTDPLPDRQTILIRVEHAQVNNIASTLTRVAAHIGRGRSKPVGVTSDYESQFLILTGTDEDLELLRGLVAELDVPQRDPHMAADRNRTSFQLIMYEVSLPRDRAASIRVDELTGKAKTPASLMAALQEVGRARVLYRIDQILKLRRSSKKKTSFTTGTRIPFVRNTTVMKSGQINKNIEYEGLGCIVHLEGTWGAPSTGSARIEVELSTLTDSTVDLGNDFKAPIFHQVEQLFEGPIKSGEPIVLLTIDGSGEKENATA
ncbi:MAG: hypothetical protein O7F76_07715, partial [Planctomycetota bacterium]|nr:hypothetical protein [Planctomycetota bacterium]